MWSPWVQYWSMRIIKGRIENNLNMCRSPTSCWRLSHFWGVRIFYYIISFIIIIYIYVMQYVILLYIYIIILCIYILLCIYIYNRIPGYPYNKPLMVWSCRTPPVATLPDLAVSKRPHEELRFLRIPSMISLEACLQCWSKAFDGRINGINPG